MHDEIKSRIKTVFNAAAEKYDRHKSSFFLTLEDELLS